MKRDEQRQHTPAELFLIAFIGVALSLGAFTMVALAHAILKAFGYA